MNYSEKNIKELKQILSDHNCTAPSGSKKADLVKLVEEIMMPDKEFIEATGETSTFEELFEESVGELISEEPQEDTLGTQPQQPDVIEDSTPEVGSPDWDGYVMSQFKSNELIDGNPICAGLRRVTEAVLGDIIESGPVQVFPASDENGPGRATVVFRVVINCFDGERRIYSEVADVWHGNTDDLFCAHPVATASTRAEGRALRKALKLRVLAAEELARKDIVEIVKQSVKSATRIDSISNQQIQFIDTFCSRFDINVMNFINHGEESYASAYDINKEKGAKMIKFLNQYQNPGAEVPQSIKGYDANWRSE